MEKQITQITAQEILRRKLPLGEFGHPVWSESYVISAMEEYAQQALQEHAANKEEEPIDLIELQNAVKTIVGIADNSHGIVGWHLNGDILTWGEIELFDTLSTFSEVDLSPLTTPPNPQP